MKNKRKKNPIRKYLYTALILYVGYVLFQQYIYLNSFKQDEIYYLQEIEKQKEIAEQYKQKKQLYKSDAYIEKTAREKLGMVYPGEKIFIDASK